MHFNWRKSHEFYPPQWALILLYFSSCYLREYDRNVFKTEEGSLNPNTRQGKESWCTTSFKVNKRCGAVVVESTTYYILNASSSATTRVKLNAFASAVRTENWKSIPCPLLFSAANVSSKDPFLSALDSLSEHKKRREGRRGPKWWARKKESPVCKPHRVGFLNLSLAVDMSLIMYYLALWVISSMSSKFIT